MPHLTIQEVIHHVGVDFKINLLGHHGLSHWDRVNQRGLELAAVTGANVKVVTLFAYLHDACREDEHEDLEHGQRGAAHMMALSAIHGLGLDEAEEKLLFEAIYDHSEGKLSSDPTIATCWDADRLDLWRVGVTPAARFLSTDAAKAMLKREMKLHIQGANLQLQGA